jgi:hypothetical protein
LHRPQLDFIPKELQREKEIVLRDLDELVSAASLQQEKSVIILVGGLFESVLYCFIQTQSDYIAARRGSFTFDPEQSLDNYVSIFNKWFAAVFTIPDNVVGYRDMVHINRELKYPRDSCRIAAPEMLRLLDTLIGKLTEYAGV